MLIWNSYLMLELKTRLDGGEGQPILQQGQQSTSKSNKNVGIMFSQWQRLGMLQGFGSAVKFWEWGIKDSMSSAVAIWLMCCFKIIYLLGLHDSSHANHLIPHCVHNKYISSTPDHSRAPGKVL